ncbi:MAG: carboxypeptidase regulatory-like domain-containing protein [Armatimonadetes bacterium]|nr:carboxypeptidase regulatory-like domain-containing protein [Armatimonadota bacterium]
MQFQFGSDRLAASMLLLALLALIASCGRSGSSATGSGTTSTGGSSGGGASAPQAQTAPAVVQGFVVQVNPVFVVGSLQDAPQGSSPRANALVTALDALGNVVGAALTNADGQYRMAVPPGLVRLQVRVDPLARQAVSVREGARGLTLLSRVLTARAYLMRPERRYHET